MIFEFSLALRVFIPIDVIKYALALCEGLNLFSIIFVVFHQSAMTLVETHILLISSFYLLIISLTVELLLFHLLRVSLLFLFFYFPDLFLELSLILQLFNGLHLCFRGSADFAASTLL